MKSRNQLPLSVIATLALTAMLTTACSQNDAQNEDAIAPNTGLVSLEQQTGAITAGDVKPGLIAFISSDRIRVRNKPESTEESIAGLLSLNDKVEVIDSTPIGQEGFIVIRVLETSSTAPKGVNLFISGKFLNSKPKDVSAAAVNTLVSAEAKTPKVEGQKQAQANRLYVVTNIATEKLRVYERCLPNEGCVSRMILETDVVNGEDEGGTRTHAGSYRITTWEKFYESPASVYPAWYKAGYPPVPAPGNRSAWFSSDYMPGGKGDMRGAFGWYTAKVGPNPSGQWHHGTAGWGADKKDFILFKDSFWGGIVNLFTNIRSHGCTRIDNESVAYLRNILPVGTPLIKVYARESYRDGSRQGYSKQPGKWSYILTKNGAQKTNNHQLADRDTVLAQGTPRSEWLDQGTYDVDQHPDVADGDLYKIGGFRGTFVIDEGTVYNYSHPSGIGRGGFKDEVIPSFMVTNDGNLSSSRDRSSSSSSSSSHTTSPANPFPFSTYGGG